MKRILILLAFWAILPFCALAQSGNVPITITEVDGSPRITNPSKITVTNGTLTVNGRNAIIATGGGGGGGSPGGSNTQVQYNNAGSFGGAAGFTFNGTGTISLGVAGSSVGAIGFRNATSGTITLQPVTGALGTVTLSLPAVTDTLVGLAATQTLTNKTLTTPVIGDFSNANHNHSNSAGGGQVAISSGISGLGTGVATALGVNVGSAGAFVTFNGAGGTPSSLTLTNATGLPPTTGISGWPANASGVLTNNGAGVLSWAAAGGGITIGTTTITSGTNTRVLYNNAGVVGEYTVTGTAGNVVLSTSPTITTPAITTSQTTTRDSIGVTSTDGIVLQNTTAAAAGAQQYSPRLRLTGQGWKTNATAASQTVDWILEARPVEGAANPTVNLAILAQVNGGGYTPAVAPGQILAPGGASTSQSLPQYSAINNSTYGLRIGRGNAGNAVSLVASAAYVTADANVNAIFLKSNAALVWGDADAAASRQVGFSSPSNSNIFLTGTTTSASANFVMGPTATAAAGTSGIGVLVIANATAPTSSPADEFQLYSADSAAGDANAFARNEAGEVSRLTGLSARVSTQFDKTSDTTLANVTGLSRNVEAGRTYAFTAVLYTTSNVAGGVKAAIGGTATATSIIYQAEVLDGSTLATMGTARATSLATTVGDVTAVTAARITITGTIVVNAGGTLTVQFAQNASNGTASSVLVNSSFQLIPIS